MEAHNTVRVHREDAKMGHFPDKSYVAITLETLYRRFRSSGPLLYTQQPEKGQHFLETSIIWLATGRIPNPKGPST